jgi:pyruvate kinase
MDQPHKTVNKTEIVCTLGPASNDVEILSELISKGMSIVRFNMGHSDYKFHKELNAKLILAEKIQGKSVKRMFDLQGPKLRISEIASDEQHFLNEGDTLNVKQGTAPSDQSTVYINYDKLFTALQMGDQIVFGDCKCVVEVHEKNYSDMSCVCNVIRAGALKSKAGVTFGGYTIENSITQKDERDLLFAIEQNCDIISMSFVANAKDIIRMKKLIAKDSKRVIPVIAKIESREAVRNLDEIMDVSDMLMIARGDLALSFSLEELPFVQDIIVEKAKKRNFFVILATQLFYSMVDSPFPTRAEVNDTAYALMQNIDALMLSDETSIGKYPVRTVASVRKLIDNYVLYLDKESFLQKFLYS